MIEQFMNDAQREVYGNVCAIIEKYQNKRNAQGLRDELEAMGFPVYSRRVTWSGGVGSWRMMRGGILRVQVLASTWGYKKGGTAIKVGAAVIGSAEYGLKYAPCIEILANGKGNYISYYHTGAQPPLKKAIPIERHRRRIFHL